MNRVLFTKEDFVFRTMSLTDIEPLCEFISTQYTQTHSLAHSYNNDPELIRPYIHSVLNNKTAYEYTIVAVYRPTGEISGCLLSCEYHKVIVQFPIPNDKIRPYIKCSEFLVELIFKKSRLDPKECLYSSKFIVHKKFQGRGLAVAIFQASIQSIVGSQFKYLLYTTPISKGSKTAQSQYGLDNIIGTYELKDFEENGTRPFKNSNTVMFLRYLLIPFPKL